MDTKRLKELSGITPTQEVAEVLTEATEHTNFIRKMAGLEPLAETKKPCECITDGCKCGGKICHCGGDCDCENCCE